MAVFTQATNKSERPLHLACIPEPTPIKFLLDELKKQDALFQMKILAAQDMFRRTPLDTAIILQKTQAKNYLLNFIQPLIDHFVFSIKKNRLFESLPVEILQDIFCFYHAPLASKEESAKFISAMFERAVKHFDILTERAARAPKLHDDDKALTTTSAITPAPMETGIPPAGCSAAAAPPAIIFSKVKSKSSKQDKGVSNPPRASHPSSDRCQYPL